jgi:hypothetical protein
LAASFIRRLAGERLSLSAESRDNVIPQYVRIAEYQYRNDSGDETQHEAGQRAEPELAVFGSTGTTVCRDVIREFGESAHIRYCGQYY